MSPRTELSLWLRSGPRTLSLRAENEGRSFPLLQGQLFHPLQHSLHLPCLRVDLSVLSLLLFQGQCPARQFLLFWQHSCSFWEIQASKPSRHSTNEPVPSLWFCFVGLVPCTEHHWLCLCCPALPETIHHLLLPSHSTSNSMSAKNAPSAP